MRVIASIILLVIAQGLVGCGSSETSLAPSPVKTVMVTGWVFDAAFRPLAGRVEVLDGPQAGASTTADPNGYFRITGTFDNDTRFRVVAEGHLALIQTSKIGPYSAPEELVFYLPAIAPPVSIAGDYSLTLIADSACDLSDEVRTRTYTATITPRADPNRAANTWFDVVLSGGLFLERYARFVIGIDGQDVALDIGHGAPSVVEQVAPNTYLAIDGSAEASVQTPSVSTLSTSFQGGFEYCVTKSEMGRSYECGPNDIVSRSRCVSKNHHVILSRR